MYYARPQLLLKVLVLVFVLPIAAEGHAQSVDAGDTVSIEKIVSIWQSTRIVEITTRFDREYTSWQKTIVSEPDSREGVVLGPGFDLRTEIDESNPTRKTGRVLFRRNADFGMRMTDLDHYEDQNVFGDRGISIRPGKSGLQGLNQVVIKRNGSTSIQSLSLTTALLYWIDPLATKLGTRISRLAEGTLPIVEDPGYGPVVQLALREENGSSRVVLAKNYDWRIVTLTQARSRETKYSFEYGRNPDGRLILNDLTYIKYDRDISDHPAFIEALTFSEHLFECDPEDLKIELPSNSFVSDLVEGTSNEYLIRHDGSIRNVTREETRLATPAEIMNTQEGELFGKAAPNRTSMWIMIAGAVFICAAIALMIKRLR